MAGRRSGGPSYLNSPSMLLVGRLVATLLSLISAPIIARAIGPEGRGETAAALALFLIVPVIIGIGMPSEIRRISAISDKDAALRAARKINAALTIASIAIGAICYFTIFSGFDFYARVAATSGVMLSSIPANWALDVSTLIARERFAAVACLQVVQPATYVTLTVAAWAFGVASVATILLAFIAGNVANFTVGLLLTRVGLRGETMPCRPLVADSLGFYGGSVSQVASSRLDQALALPLIGAQQAGFYSVAVTVGSIPIVLGHALGGSYFRSIARASGPEKVRLQSEAVRCSIAVALMCCPVLALVAWPMVPVVFGAQFHGAVPAALFGVLAGGLQLVSFVAATAVTADGRGRLLTYAQTAGLILGICSLAVLGQIAGAIGAALASALGFVTTIFILARSFKTTPWALLPRSSDFATSLQRLWRT